MHRDGVAAHARAGGGRGGAGGVRRRLLGHVQPGGRAPYGVPTAGTAAHAFTLLHDDERAAFAAQVKSLGRDTTLLVDTYDIRPASSGPSTSPGRSSARSASTPATSRRSPARSASCSTASARPSTRIVRHGDLDEFAIAALAAAPVDSYGVGTSVVTGSGAPTAGLVYKLVAVDGRPVAKRRRGKEGHGGRKSRAPATPTGTAIAEVVSRGGQPARGGPARPRGAGAVDAGRCGEPDPSRWSVPRPAARVAGRAAARRPPAARAGSPPSHGVAP